MQHKSIISLGAALAGIAVILGAFGAHALKQILPAEQIITFETGVRYQMYHSIALILVGFLLNEQRNRSLIWAAYCFITSILLFSGSLYALALLKANGQVGLGGLGVLTPIGGVFFISGWALMSIGVAKKQR